MITVRGRGYLVPVAFGLAIILGNTIDGRASNAGPQGFVGLSLMQLALSSIAAVLLFILGKKWNAPAEKRSGEPPQRAWTHDFCYVPMQYAAVGIFLLILGLYILKPL